MSDLIVAQSATPAQQALQDAFTSALTKILDFTPFNEDWVVEDEGEKYLFAIVHHDLAIGEVCKSQTEDGRRIIMVGTRVGVVAVLEAYPLGHAPFILDIFSPESLDFFLGIEPGDLVDLAKFTRVLSPFNPSQNIGTYMDKLERVMAVHRRVKTRTLERAEEAQLFRNIERCEFVWSDHAKL